MKKQATFVNGQPELLVRSDTPEDANFLNQFLGRYAAVRDVSPKDRSYTAIILVPAGKADESSAPSQYVSMNLDDMYTLCAQRGIPIEPGVKRDEVERTLKLFDRMNPSAADKGGMVKEKSGQAAVTGGSARTKTGNAKTGDDQP